MSDDLIWRPQGKALSVHLSKVALRQLAAELPRVGTASSGRALESGGLMLGYARQSGDEWLVRVEQLVPVDIEHARGESWTLSSTDRKHLEQCLRKYTKQSDLHTVVGWYRTHTRTGLYLDQHDFNLFTDFFRHDGSIALLASPRHRQGGIFFWEEGDIRRTAPYLTFDIPEVTAAAQPVPVTPERGDHVHVPKWALAIPVVAGILLGIFWNPSPLKKVNPAVTQLPQLREGEPSEDRPVFAPPPLPAQSAQATEPYVPPPEEEPVSRARAEAPVKQPARTLVAPPPHRSIPEPQLAEAPPLVAASNRSDARLATTVRMPEVHAEVEPPRPSGVRKVVGSIPGLGFLKRRGNAGNRDDYVPPRIVKQAEPKLHRPINQEINLRFKLMINSDGHIQRAELLTRKVDSELANSAFDALKRWRFEPAARNNKPVPAELEVQFRIAPGAVAERRPSGAGGGTD